MVKELYQIITRQVTINVAVGRVESVRKKNITRSGCRVYRDGYIGVAGCLGEPTEETWAAAERALERKVTSPGPETGKVRTRELREEALTAGEFVARTEALLDALREEFPDFVLSNKVTMTETETRLRNDQGLDYVNLNRTYSIGLVVKQVGSPNAYDSVISGRSRRFEAERWLAEGREILNAHRNLLPMPEGETQLFLDTATGDSIQNFELIYRALDGRAHSTNSAPLFQGKVGEQVFDPRVSLVSDRTEDIIGLKFFDAEGVTLPEDKTALIDHGVLRRLEADKKYAALLGQESTAMAGGAYDDAPSLGYAALSVESTGQTIRELAGDRDAILLCISSGGSWTDEGNFATPVQCAYLYRDGRLVGRLPEFGMAVSANELFGDRFVGCSTDRFQDSRWLAFEGTVQ